MMFHNWVELAFVNACKDLKDHNMDKISFGQ